MSKLLASLLLIISSAVIAQNYNALDPAQIYNTNNLVTFNQNGSQTTSPWQNVGQWGGQLSCWAPGNPGYCGPNPYVNANGYGMINFSYGYTDLYQVVDIAKALPNSGTGLRVNGFTFGFTAKNGNGWDGGRQDFLEAYVNFYKADGTLERNYNYGQYTNQVYNWTNFSFTESFNTPYASKDLSTVRYGFVGYDTNFWAGPYGPEIYNVSFSLNYSVDPCATNPLYSATCPGFSDALAKLTIVPTVDNSTVTATTTTPTTTITTSVADNPTNPTVTVTSTPVQQNSNNKVDSAGLSLGLSVISRNQQREQTIANQAVQNAVSTATAAATASQQEAMNVASLAVANSTQSSLGGLGPIGNIGLRLYSSQYGINSSQSMDVFGAPENYGVKYNNMLIDRTNPLNEYTEFKPSLGSSTTTGPVVNRNVSNNEAAGGVDLTKMAIAPSGYNDYLNFTMRDASFYAPKEVYKNQKNVDNARILRQLTNDSRHQQMVEQQYRR